MNVRDLGIVAPADMVLCADTALSRDVPGGIAAQPVQRYQTIPGAGQPVPQLRFIGVSSGLRQGRPISAEGETHYELHPTYRVLCDALYAVGFTTVFEVIGDQWRDIPLYADGNVRSFIAAKDDAGVFGDFLRRVPR